MAAAVFLPMVVLSPPATGAGPEGIDQCLVGHWVGQQVAEYAPSGLTKVGGGAGFFVTFDGDGTETLDYDAMQPVTMTGLVGVKGRDATCTGCVDTADYRGTASGKISTRDGVAHLESIITAAVRDRPSSIIPDFHPIGGLGPGALAPTTREDVPYVCTPDTLTYKSKGGVQFLSITLKRVEHVAAMPPATVSPSPVAPPSPSPPPVGVPPEPPPAPPGPEPPPVAEPRPSPPPPTTPPVASIPPVCPQAGNGCVVLMIDYGPVARERDFSRLVEPLKKVACDVDYVAPNFQSPLTAKDDADRKRILAGNDAEKQKVLDAIARFRARLVSQKPEIAMEFFNAHGGTVDDNPGDTFGTDALSYTWSVRISRISRGRRLAGDYTAANKNVCSWYVLDSSCFSGMTARAVDTLNNTGAANYTLLPIDNTALHAGYDRDIAVGTATSTTECRVTDTTKMAQPLIKLVDRFRSDWGLRADKNGIVHPGDYKGLVAALQRSIYQAGSYYIDNGYKTPGTLRSGYDFSRGP